MRFIYLDKAGNPVGPVDESVIVQEIRNGHLQADSAIRNASLQEFHTVAEFPNFQPFLQLAPQTAAKQGGLARLKILAEENASRRDQSALGAALCPGDASAFRRFCAMFTDLLLLLSVMLLIFLLPMSEMHIWGELDKEETMLQLEFCRVYQKSEKTSLPGVLQAADFMRKLRPVKPVPAAAPAQPAEGESTVYGRALNGSRRKIKNITEKHNAAVQKAGETPAKSVPQTAQSGGNAPATSSPSSEKQALAGKFTSATAGETGEVSPQVSMQKMPGGEIMGQMLPNRMPEWDASAAGRVSAGGRSSAAGGYTAGSNTGTYAASGKAKSRAQTSRVQGVSRYSSSHSLGGAGSAFEQARGGSEKKMVQHRMAVGQQLSQTGDGVWSDLASAESPASGGGASTAGVRSRVTSVPNGGTVSGRARSSGSAGGVAGAKRAGSGSVPADFAGTAAADRSGTVKNQVSGNPGSGPAMAEKQDSLVQSPKNAGSIAELLNSDELKKQTGGKSGSELMQTLPSAQKARREAAVAEKRKVQPETPFSFRDLLITGCAIHPEKIQLRLGSGIRKIPRAEFQSHYQKPLKWAVLAVVLYYTLCFSIFAQTFGMWFWGIFLTRSRVAEVLPLRALLYTAVMLLCAVFMIPCVLLTKRSLADWICRVRQIGVGSVSKS